MSAARTRPDRAELWLSLGVFVAAVIFQLPILDRWMALLDEGYVLAIAEDINRGRVLYRDVTIDAPFPLAFYLLAGWLQLLGSSVLASRWLAAIGFGVFATAMFRVSRLVLPRGWALGLFALLLCYRVWAFPHWQVYSYTTTSLLGILAAVHCLLRFFDARRPAWLVAAGLFFGFSVYCKQGLE